jgi:hypothetical protein
MPRTITLDKSAIQELNKDNKDLAKVFTDQYRVNLATIDSPHYQMAESEYQKLNPAEKQLADDLHVRHLSYNTSAMGSTRDLPNVDGVARYIEQLDPGVFKTVAPQHEDTVRLAWGGELLTFDPQLATTYNRLTARLPTSVWTPRGLVPELANVAASNKPPIFYDAARKNLALQPLNITPDGAVHPTPGYTRVKMGGKTVGWVTPDKEGFVVAEGGPRTEGGARTTKKIDRVVGDPITAPMEFGPSANGEAAMGGIVLVLQGINYLLSKINGPIQQRRFEAAWNRRKAAVEQRLNEDPQLGAMIFVYYSSYVTGEASVIDGGMAFQDIQIAYGFTQDEALRAYRAQDIIVAAGPGNQTGDQIWIKPRAPLDIRKLQLPVGTTVAGLGTFVPGKEKMVRVTYRVLGGFDDTALSREELDVPKGFMPRFYYLWPPKCISYVYNGAARQRDVDWTISDDADESFADIDASRKLQKGIPVVKLDSDINPSTWFSEGATAAMVWPADNATANLFLKIHSTFDPVGALGGLGYTMLRWVRPEFIRVLKDPFDFEPSS